jgi:FKBP-type peptidyl-prolyl cis-trans isomerase
MWLNVMPVSESAFSYTNEYYLVALAQQMPRGMERVCDVLGAMADALSFQRERRKKTPASRKQNWVQSHIHATKQSHATQSEAKTKMPNPHTRRQAGLHHLRRGLARPRIGVRPAAHVATRVCRARHTRPTDTGTHCPGTGQR